MKTMKPIKTWLSRAVKTDVNKLWGIYKQKEKFDQHLVLHCMSTTLKSNSGTTLNMQIASCLVFDAFLEKWKTTQTNMI